MTNQSNITNALFLFGERFHLNRSEDSMLNDSYIRYEITEFISKVNFWITIMEILMFIFGLFGNGLALIVINSRSLRGTSSSVFITYLAIFDISVLVVRMADLATSHWVQSAISHCFLAYLTDLVTFCSIWIMVIMTLERCVAVRSPFLAKRFCTPDLARYSIYILIFFSIVLFSSTFPVIHTIDKRQQKCGVRRQYQMLMRLVKATIFFFVPDILLLANLFVIYELYIAKRQRTKTLMNPENAIHQLNAISFNRKQQQLTIMLVTVSLSFYIFTTPAIIDYIRQMKPLKDRNVKRLKMRLLTANLSVLWLQMSSATNFIFYCLAGSKFRAASFDKISAAWDYVQTIFNHEDYHIRRRRRKQEKSDMCLTSNTTQGVRNGLQNNRNKRRSTSVQQTYIYPLNNSSKVPNNETIPGSQSNSRQTSRAVLNSEV